MQTALKILSERPELAKQASPAGQASSGAAELAGRAACGAAEYGAPQPERSRLSRQVSNGAADQAEQVSSEAAQHAAQIHPGRVVSRGVAGSRVAKETSAAEAMPSEAATQAEVAAAEDVVGAPSSASAAAAPQADEEAAEADEHARLPRKGIVLEQVTGPAHRLPPFEAEQPEQAVSHVSAVPSPATEADSGANAAQQSQSVELASAEETAHSAFEQQPAQPNEMMLPKADDSAQLKEPPPVVSRSLGIAGDLSRKRERSMGLEKLEEQEKPRRGSPARQGSILGAGQPSNASEPSDKLQWPLAASPELQGTADPADGAAESTALTNGTHAEAADAESGAPEVAVNAAMEQDTSITAGTAAGPAVSVMADGQRPASDASAAEQAVESDGALAAAADGHGAAAHMQAGAASERPAAASEAHSHTGAISGTATGLHHSHIAPYETPLSAGALPPAEQPERQVLPSADHAEGSLAMVQPGAADVAACKMASAELLCEEVLPDTPRHALQQGISHSHPSAATAGPELPGAQECSATTAKAGGAPQDSPNIAAALLQAGSSITVRASKHKRSAAGAPADVPQTAAEEPCIDHQPHTAVAISPQAAADLGASAPADALKASAQGPHKNSSPPATADKATGAADAVKPATESLPADAFVAAESADAELEKHDEPCATAPIAAQSASVEEPLRDVKPLTAALDAATVNGQDLDSVRTTVNQRQL